MHIFPCDKVGFHRPVAMRIDGTADFCYLLPALTVFVLQKGHSAAAGWRLRYPVASQY